MGSSLIGTECGCDRVSSVVAVDDLIGNPQLHSCPKDRCHTHARLSSWISRADSVGTPGASPASTSGALGVWRPRHEPGGGHCSGRAWRMRGLYGAARSEACAGVFLFLTLTPITHRSMLRSTVRRTDSMTETKIIVRHPRPPPSGRMSMFPKRMMCCPQRCARMLGLRCRHEGIQRRSLSRSSGVPFVVSR